MKIGVVGPEYSVDKVVKVINTHYPYIDVITYKKEKVEDIQNIMDDCIEQADGILFTGIAVLGEAIKKSKIEKPYEAVLRNDSSIMKAFWDIRNDNKKIDRLSIDVVEEDLVHEVADEFGIKIETMYVQPYDAEKAEKEYVKKHIKFLEEGKADILISGFGSVYDELKSKGLPVYRLNITTPLIKLAMQNLINRVKTDQIKANQIAIQILKIKNINNNISSQYENLIKKNAVEKILIDYVKEVQGSFFQFGMDKYIIFSTRRTLDNNEILSGFLKIVSDFERQGITIYSGLGFGNTGWNAEYNAINALEIAEKAQKAALYIVDENSGVRGPINDLNEINYDLLVYDEKINDMAKKIGISATYLSKIISIMKKSNEGAFSSDTLGYYLGITERSARRILDKIISAGYGEVSTSAVNKGIGRPKKIVKIKI